MRWSKWSMLFAAAILSIMLVAALAFTSARGQTKGNNSAGQGAKQGQWVNNQPPGWSGQGKRQGWQKQGSALPVGLDEKGNYPKGLQKRGSR